MGELVHNRNYMEETAYEGRAERCTIPIEIQDNQTQKKRISSEIFFACENCDGPLIQHAFCRICKKTDLRVCLKCKHVKSFGDHRNCLRIVMLDMKKIFSRGDEDI